MKVETFSGRKIETNIADRSFEPYNGAKKYSGSSKVISFEKALQECKIKDGMTLSFHHQLRNGDFVVNLILDAISNMGVKDLRIAQTAFFDVHEPVIEHIKNGVVTRIEGSCNGPVGDYCCKNPLEQPVILRSHGGRWAAVETGELHPNIAFIAASAADIRGNATGLIGSSAFGNIAYSGVDAVKADNVVIVTDNIVDYPCYFRDIYEGLVDYVVEVDKIGDPNKIVSGSLKVTDDSMKLSIARNCVDLMDAAGIVKEGMIFQAGAGGISLAAIKYLGELLNERGIAAGSSTGGLTKYIVDMYHSGCLKQINTCQCFDMESVKFASKHPEFLSTIGEYSNPLAKGRNIDRLSTVVLGATEVDTSFNVNVNTHSDGRMLHGIGGHQDVSTAANLSIMAVPVFRKTNPIVREKVTTISTPGDVVDAIVTNEGIAINPNRKDLIEKIKGKIEIVPIEELKNIAYSEAGEPNKPNLGEEIVGITKFMDGTVLDNIYRVLE